MTTTIASTATKIIGAGPLTTVFTTPDFCQSLYWNDVATPPLSSSVCMPPRFPQYWNYSWGKYSPGICPSGYTEGCGFPTSLAISTLGTPYYGGPLSNSETARMCCPTGYTCWTGSPSSYHKCISTESMTSYWTTVDSSEVLISTEALAYLIQVRWQESDLSILETDPTVPGSTYSATETAVSAVTTADVPNKSQLSSTGTSARTGASFTSATATSTEGDSGLGETTTSNENLSTGATIALAVALPTASLLLGSFAFLICRYHYKKKDPPGHDQSHELDGGQNANYHEDYASSPAELLSPLTAMKTGTDRSELDAMTVTGRDTDSLGEMDGMTMTELETKENAQELPAPVFIAELEGSTPIIWRERFSFES